MATKTAVKETLSDKATSQKRCKHAYFSSSGKCEHKEFNGNGTTAQPTSPKRRPGRPKTLPKAKEVKAAPKVKKPKAAPSPAAQARRAESIKAAKAAFKARAVGARQAKTPPAPALFVQATAPRVRAEKPPASTPAVAVIEAQAPAPAATLPINSPAATDTEITLQIGGCLITVRTFAREAHGATLGFTSGNGKQNFC